MKPTLPLWILTTRNVQRAPRSIPCDAPGHALAFSASDKLVAFLDARQAGEWKVRLLNNYDDAVLLLADLHQHGVPGLCVNTSPDGQGGTRLPLEELLAEIQRTRGGG